MNSHAYIIRGFFGCRQDTHGAAPLTVLMPQYRWPTAISTPTYAVTQLTFTLVVEAEITVLGYLPIGINRSNILRGLSLLSCLIFLCFANVEQVFIFQEVMMWLWGSILE